MVKYFNGYNKVNNPSYLTKCHNPCARMLQMLRVYCDIMRFRILVVHRFSNVQMAHVIYKLNIVTKLNKKPMVHNAHLSEQL